MIKWLIRKIFDSLIIRHEIYKIISQYNEDQKTIEERVNALYKISALSRVGVVFTNKQKKEIERLYKEGKRKEAQSIILNVIEDELGETDLRVTNQRNSIKKSKNNHRSPFIFRNEQGETVKKLYTNNNE